MGFRPAFPGIASKAREAIGFVLGLVARVWLSTLRVAIVAHPALADHGDRLWVLSFFHGTQFPLLAWRKRRPTLVLVSHSADGSLQAGALRAQGFWTIRGSSSRGGARALAALVRCMRRAGADAAFAVDGPRGPLGQAKGGALTAARAAGGILVPMGSWASAGYVFGRAWDRYALAWPFARVVIVLGAPLFPTEPSPNTCPLASLSAAIAAANGAARARGLNAWPGDTG